MKRVREFFRDHPASPILFLLALIYLAVSIALFVMAIKHAKGEL